MKNFYHRKRIWPVRKDFFPGWKMTEDQHGKYWRMIGQCCRAMGAATAAERDEARQIIHYRAFNRDGVSAKQIDHLKMFDAFVGACLAIIQPNDVGAQLKQATMGSFRLVYRIHQLAPEIYWRAEAKRKFGHDNLELLSEADLTMFRNHLSARASEIVWPEPVSQPENYQPVNRLVSVPEEVEIDQPF